MRRQLLRWPFSSASYPNTNRLIKWLRSQQFDYLLGRSNLDRGLWESASPVWSFAKSWLIYQFSHSLADKRRREPHPFSLATQRRAEAEGLRQLYASQRWPSWTLGLITNPYGLEPETLATVAKIIRATWTICRRMNQPKSHGQGRTEARKPEMRYQVYKTQDCGKIYWTASDFLPYPKSIQTVAPTRDLNCTWAACVRT